MIMSLEEARAILGKDGEDLTDEQLERLIRDLEGLAQAYFAAVRRGEIKVDTLEIKPLNDKDVSKVAEYFEILDKIDRGLSSGGNKTKP